MRLLLDTHLLLWALAEPRKLPIRFRRELESAEVYVSAASIWEIAIKNSIGKIDADPRAIFAAVEPAGFRHLAVTGLHAAGVSALRAMHRDPFDRLLVAQALSEPMQLVTNDAVLAEYSELVRLLWHQRALPVSSGRVCGSG